MRPETARDAPTTKKGIVYDFVMSYNDPARGGPPSVATPDKMRKRIWK